MTTLDAQSKTDIPHQVKASGEPLTIGTGFTGLGFRHTQFAGAMDPVIMVDHYTMTIPTFGVHPHAGLAAVSVLFEDTKGKFHNRDSLGNDFDIQAGDLYWLNAASGALHDEAPREGSKIHGLQIFVNLPARIKHQAPSSLHVKKENMPTLVGEGYRVRLVLGESNGYQSQDSPVWPFTILDGLATRSADFSHQVPQGFNAWLYAVEGGLEYQINDEWFQLVQGESATVNETDRVILKVRGTSQTNSHFVILSGETIKENFIQYGPFVMNTQQEIADVVTRYQAGELGRL